MTELGKTLVGLGILVAVVGGVLMLAGRFGIPGSPRTGLGPWGGGIPLGRLPGDFAWRGKNVSVFLPLGTSILLSVLLTVVLYVVSRLHR